MSFSQWKTQSDKVVPASNVLGSWVGVTTTLTIEPSHYYVVAFAPDCIWIGRRCIPRANPPALLSSPMELGSKEVGHVTSSRQPKTL
jgi:hypothetical protein